MSNIAVETTNKFNKSNKIVGQRHAWVIIPYCKSSNHYRKPIWIGI